MLIDSSVITASCKQTVTFVKSKAESASTDIKIIKSECEDLGVDWKDICIYRTQEAIADWNVLGFVREL